MSRRGNCCDNAAVKSFFNLLKRERIRRKNYKTREETRRTVFDDIEFFYNPQRKHLRNDTPSPIAFEQQQKLKLHGVRETGGLFNRRPVAQCRGGLCGAAGPDCHATWGVG